MSKLPVNRLRSARKIERAAIVQKASQPAAFRVGLCDLEATYLVDWLGKPVLNTKSGRRQLRRTLARWWEIVTSRQDSDYTLVVFAWDGKDAT